MCARAPSGRPRHAMTCSPRPCVRTRIQPSFSVSNRRVYMCAESEYRSPRLFDHGRAAPRRKEAARRCIAGSRPKRSAFPAVRRVRDVGGAIGDQYSVGCGRARAAPMFGEGYLQNAPVHSYRHEGTSLRSMCYVLQKHVIASNMLQLHTTKRFLRTEGYLFNASAHLQNAQQWG